MKTTLLVEIRHFVAVLAGVAFVWVAVDVGYGAFRSDKSLLGSIALFASLLVIGIGLILDRFWPRRITAAFALVIAVLLPVGYINPFNAMDLPPPPPTLTEILAWMAPTVIGLLVFAWLVDPPRARKDAA